MGGEVEAQRGWVAPKPYHLHFASKWNHLRFASLLPAPCRTVNPVPNRDEFERSECPIACGLDLVGDKWTLLVLRDLLLGKSRFGELQNSPERIPTNILTERLRRLETHGLIERVPIEGSKRFEYQTTKMGREMRPVILAIVKWSNRHIEGTWMPPPDWLR